MGTRGDEIPELPSGVRAALALATGLLAGACWSGVCWAAGALRGRPDAAWSDRAAACLLLALASVLLGSLMMPADRRPGRKGDP